MTDEDFERKWQAGKDILEEMGFYLMSEGGIEDYENAIKILELIDKFEVTKNEYKAMLQEAKISQSTDRISVPDFRGVEEYVAKIKGFANLVKRSFC